MQKDFLDKYGYCEIPKGTILYRGHRSNELYDEMFFGTKLNPVKCFGNGEVEIWKVKKKIQELFLVKHININSHGISSIPDLYYDLYPNEPNKTLSDLCIKQIVDRRRAFAQDLHLVCNINGWFSSIENGIENEICLFGKENITDLVERIDVINIENKEESDSLRKIKVFPHESFFSISSEITSKYNSSYKQYRTNARSWVKDYINEGLSASHAKNIYFNLRLKLKI